MLEFRCFITNKKLNCVCQYFDNCYFENVIQNKDKIKNKILEKWEEIKDSLPFQGMLHFLFALISFLLLFFSFVLFSFRQQKAPFKSLRISLFLWIQNPLFLFPFLSCRFFLFLSFVSDLVADFAIDKNDKVYLIECNPLDTFTGGGLFSYTEDWEVRKRKKERRMKEKDKLKNRNRKKVNKKMETTKNRTNSKSPSGFSFSVPFFYSLSSLFSSFTFFFFFFFFPVSLSSFFSFQIL